MRVLDNVKNAPENSVLASVAKCTTRRKVDDLHPFESTEGDAHDDFTRPSGSSRLLNQLQRQYLRFATEGPS